MSVPSVTLTLVLEGDPRIVLSAESEADKDALHAWVEAIYPNVDQTLREIAHVIRAKKQAA